MILWRGISVNRAGKAKRYLHSTDCTLEMLFVFSVAYCTVNPISVNPSNAGLKQLLLMQNTSVLVWTSFPSLSLHGFFLYLRFCPLGLLWSTASQTSSSKHWVRFTAVKGNAAHYWCFAGRKLLAHTFTDLLLTVYRLILDVSLTPHNCMSRAKYTPHREKWIRLAHCVNKFEANTRV